jgi:hypothetical protein
VKLQLFPILIFIQHITMIKFPSPVADAERVRKEEQSKIDNAEVLTEEEEGEKGDLLQQVCLHTD